MKHDLLPILVIEDSDEDFDVLNLSIYEAGIKNELLRASDGLAALRLLNERRERDQVLPGLIVLDLNLIGIDGKEVLKRLKADPVFVRIPTIILSTSSSSKDVETCYSLGAAAYAVKPVSLEKLEAFVLALKGFWLDQAVLPHETHIDRFRRLNG
jgi:CheY-like chemotaxis protein